MFRKIWLLAALVAVMALVCNVSPVHAGFKVENQADLVYYTSVQQLISYTDSDTAWIVVLYGPKMTLVKYVQNVITNESSTTMVHVSRGESVTFHLFSENTDPADTDSWHVSITDNFATLSMVVGQSASVGPNVATDTFTYVTGTVASDAGDSYTAPDSVQYYVTGSGWTDSQAWSARNEATAYPGGPGGAANISGFRFYWLRVSSQNAWSDAADANVSTAGDYKIHMSFSILRNDN